MEHQSSIGHIVPNMHRELYIRWRIRVEWNACWCECELMVPFIHLLWHASVRLPHYHCRQQVHVQQAGCACVQYHRFDLINSLHHYNWVAEIKSFIYKSSNEFNWNALQTTLLTSFFLSGYAVQCGWGMLIRDGCLSGCIQHTLKSETAYKCLLVLQKSLCVHSTFKCFQAMLVHKIYMLAVWVLQYIYNCNCCNVSAVKPVLSTGLLLN